MAAIDEYLKDYFSSIQMNEEANPYFVYQETIDPKLKDKILFVEIKDHILYVRALHPSYKQLFKLQELSFLKKIKERLPSLEIKKIVFTR